MPSRLSARRGSISGRTSTPTWDAASASIPVSYFPGLFCYHSACPFRHLPSSLSPTTLTNLTPHPPFPTLPSIPNPRSLPQVPRVPGRGLRGDVLLLGSRRAALQALPRQPRPLLHSAARPGRLRQGHGVRQEPLAVHVLRRSCCHPPRTQGRPLHGIPHGLDGMLRKRRHIPLLRHAGQPQGGCAREVESGGGWGLGGVCGDRWSGNLIWRQRVLGYCRVVWSNVITMSKERILIHWRN